MKKTNVAVGLLIGLFWLFPFALAADTGHKTITAPEVKDLLENHKGVVVHVLSEIEFEIQHIPGSINIPIHKVSTSDKLPTNLDTPLVFYCMGER